MGVPSVTCTVRLGSLARLWTLPLLICGTFDKSVGSAQVSEFHEHPTRLFPQDHQPFVAASSHRPSGLFSGPLARAEFWIRLISLELSQSPRGPDALPRAGLPPTAHLEGDEPGPTSLRPIGPGGSPSIVVLPTLLRERAPIQLLDLVRCDIGA